MSTPPNSQAKFDTKKELARFPECPDLNEADIIVVTKTVFATPNPQPADVLFVFGSSRDDRWQQVADLYHNGFAPLVFIGGGISGKSLQTGRILSHMIRDDLAACGIPTQAIIVDERSTNTLEDAQFAKEIFEQKGIIHDRILFACKWPHSGRCLRTLQKVFPDSKLFPFMYDFEYDGKLVTREICKTWWHHKQSRSFVWGEYQRIKLYSSRGDIC